MALPAILLRVGTGLAGIGKGARGATTALKPMLGVLGSLSSAAMAAGAAMVGFSAAIAVIIRRSTAFGATLVDTSNKLGVGVAELQKFRYAAEQTGVSSDTADMALQRFTRRVSEAARGTGEARGALAELGIQLRDGSGNLRSTESVLMDVADAMQQTGSQSDRVRIAMKLFDSEGVALVNTLQNGSRGLQAMYRDAESLGAILNQTSAEGMKAFDDELTRLNTVVTGVTNQITAALAPALRVVTQDLVNYVTDLADSKGGFEELGRFLAVELVQALGNMAKGFVHVYNTMIPVIQGMMALGNAIRYASGQDPIELDLQPLSTDKIDAFTQSLIEGVNTAGQAASEQIEPFDLGTISPVETYAPPEFIDNMLNALFDPNRVEAFWYDWYHTADNNISKTQSLMNLMFDDVDMGSLRMQFEQFTDTTKTMEDGFIKAAGALQDGLVSAIKTGKMGFSEIRDIILDMIIKMFVQKAIMGPLGSLFGMRASGGPVAANKPYIVGERGPELFTPSTNGSITNATDTAGMMGGSQQVTYNITATDAQSFKQMLARDPEFLHSVAARGGRSLPR